MRVNRYAWLVVVCMLVGIITPGARAEQTVQEQGTESAGAPPRRIEAPPAVLVQPASTTAMEQTAEPLMGTLVAVEAAPWEVEAPPAVLVQPASATALEQTAAPAVGRPVEVEVISRKVQAPRPVMVQKDFTTPQVRTAPAPQVQFVNPPSPRTVPAPAPVIIQSTPGGAPATVGPPPEGASPVSPEQQIE